LTYHGCLTDEKPHQQTQADNCCIELRGNLSMRMFEVEIIRLAFYSMTRLFSP